MRENVTRKPLYKLWWFWVVMGILSTIIFGAMGACTDPETEPGYDDYFTESTVTTSTVLQETTVAEIATEVVTTIVETTVEETTAQPEPIVTDAPAVVAPVVVEPEPEQEDDYGYVQDFPAVEEEPVEDNGQNYVLNTNTYKFHYPSCASAKKIKSHNREDFYGTREEVIARGFDPCKNCHP